MATSRRTVVSLHRLAPLLLVAILGLLLAGCRGREGPGSPPVPVAQPEPTATATPTSSPTPAPRTEPETQVSPTPLPSPTPSPTATRPGPEEAHLILEPVVEGLERPIFVTHAGDGSGRLFVVEKAGRILVVREGEEPQVFLDIRDRVGSRGSEQGLLGLAFPPGYPERQVFFVNYTDRQGDTVIARYRVGSDPDRADPASEFQVLWLDQPAANHNGGMLLFGSDGYLYIGTGDGGRANDVFGNGQNPATLLGKMLRVDVLRDPTVGYTIPPENPWIEATWNGQEVRDEIWALGLRNPWRYSFDRLTGDLWIGDVGQDRYEEIHFVAAERVVRGGLNFGWPIMEANHCFPEDRPCDRTGLEIPVVEYELKDGNCAVVAGYVYRGPDAPPLEGSFLFADFCSGRIWSYWVDPGGTPRTTLLLDTDLAISSFGEDQEGSVYVVDYRGAIYRIRAE